MAPPYLFSCRPFPKAIYDKLQAIRHTAKDPPYPPSTVLTAGLLALCEAGQRGEGPRFLLEAVRLYQLESAALDARVKAKHALKKRRRAAGKKSWQTVLERRRQEEEASSGQPSMAV